MSTIPRTTKQDLAIIALRHFANSGSWVRDASRTYGKGVLEVGQGHKSVLLNPDGTIQVAGR